MRRPVIADLTKFHWSGRLMMRGLEAFFASTRLPLVGRLPWVSAKETSMCQLPINEDIRLHEDAPIPVDLLDRFIEEASHRVIYNSCACRSTFECKHYPADIGCLLMGDSALDSPPGIYREASVEEAKDLVRRALEAGLVPAAGKARIDNLAFGIKERHQLLSVCFCCECCCLTRYIRRAPLRLVEAAFPRLEGLTVETTDACRGCGICVSHCYIKARRVEGGRAVADGYCRGCGRCAGACPNGAVVVTASDPAYLDKYYAKVRSHVKFD